MDPMPRFNYFLSNKNGLLFKIVYMAEKKKNFKIWKTNPS